MTLRKKYTKEFKEGAVNLVKEQGYSCREAGASLGVHGTLISRWVKEASVKAEPFPGNGNSTPEQQEIRRLQEEVRRLKMEKEILKKAAAFFAQETN
jgi:transposase